MTRLSTGYTFLNIQEHSRYIVKNIDNIYKAKIFSIGKKYQFIGFFLESGPQNGTFSMKNLSTENRSNQSGAL